MYTYGISYNQTAVNAEKYGGAASLINHGVPNCAFGSKNGKPVVIALRDIPKGEFLHTDYGFKYNSLTPYHDVGKIQEAITYLLARIKDPSISECIGSTEDLKLACISSEASGGGGEAKSDVSDQTHIEVKYIENLLKYLFRTPLSMLELLAKDRITKSQILDLFNAYVQIPISTDEINTCDLITSLLLLSNQYESAIATYYMMGEKTVEQLCFRINHTSKIMGSLGSLFSTDQYYDAAKHLMDHCLSLSGEVRIVLNTQWYKVSRPALARLRIIFPKLYEDISQKIGVKIVKNTGQSFIERITSALKSIPAKSPGQKTLFQKISDQLGDKIFTDKGSCLQMNVKTSPVRAEEIRQACEKEGIDVNIVDVSKSSSQQKRVIK